MLVGSKMAYKRGLKCEFFFRNQKHAIQNNIRRKISKWPLE